MGWCCLHKVRVKTHLIWNSHHRPNQDLHLCQGNYISLSHHGRKHNDIPTGHGTFPPHLKDCKPFPKFFGLIPKSYGNCWTNSSGMHSHLLLWIIFFQAMGQAVAQAVWRINLPQILWSRSSWYASSPYTITCRTFPNCSKQFPQVSGMILMNFV